MNLISNHRRAILIKISGGCLQTANGHEIFDHQKLVDLVEQIVQIHSNYNIGLVIGGGNLWRGKANYLPNLSVQTSHYVGMFATMMNGFVIRDYLVKQNLQVALFSGIEASQVVEPINPFAIEKALNERKILLFVGGTGMPYVSTDTASAVRAAQINATQILMGKDNVDGVYSLDPKKNLNAQFFSNLSFQDVIVKHLEVVDAAAMTICEQAGIEIMVFNQAIPQAFVKALKREIKHTLINKKGE